VGKACKAKPPRRHKGRLRRCALFVRVGGFTHADVAGRVKLHFTGRVNRKPLALGRYRLVAVARNAAGKTSRPLSLEFRVIR
jgi:hypothetical protein